MTERKARPRIYYGWHVLSVLTAASFVGAGSSQVFFGAMLLPITDDLGWSRSAIAGAVTAGTFVGGLSQPVTGALADRYGTRVMTSFALVVLALAFFGMASMNQVWHLFLTYIVGRGITMAAISGVVPRTAAVNWFRRMRGRAMGFVNTAPALGSAVLALTGRGFVGAGTDWRTVFVVFGIAALAMVPLAAVVLRRRPEDMDLLPDGDTPADDEPGSAQCSAAAPEASWSLAEARRTPALWFITFGLFTGAASTGAVGFHMVAYFTDRGITDSISVVALSAFAFSGAISSVAWGFLTERFSERLLAVGAVAMGALVTLAFTGVTTGAAAIAVAMLYGFALRGEGSLLNIILAQYYGRESFGTIAGFVSPIQMVGLSIGPAAAALAFEATGSYNIVFVSSSALLASAALGLWLARRPALSAIEQAATV